MFSVVVVTPDVVGERMAGPGIRAFHFTEELRKHFPTTLVSKGMPLYPIENASVVVGQPVRGLRRMHGDQRLVFDLFDPVLLELHEIYGNEPSIRQRIHLGAERWRLRRALRTGDLFLCATPHQRELYPSVSPRIIEVPFGAEQNAPAATPRENIIVWGGGTWEWLDPDTAVRAVIDVNRAGLSCRLRFLGRSRPNTALANRGDRIDRLIETGRPYVEANDEWVRYRDRLAELGRCKIAIMLHHDTAEARYSIRTRLFDAIAAAVPVIATAGGFAADLVASERLGIVVPPDDSAAVAEAIRRLLTDDDFYSSCVLSLERVRPRFAWSIVTRPLVDAIQRWKR